MRDWCPNCGTVLALNTDPLEPCECCEHKPGDESCQCSHCTTGGICIPREMQNECDRMLSMPVYPPPTPQDP